MNQFSAVELQALAVMEEAIARSYAIDAVEHKGAVRRALLLLARRHAYRAGELRAHKPAEPPAKGGLLTRVV